MCEKCKELDNKIEHYERIRASIGDQLRLIESRSCWSK
jgi:hypothetical protein